MIEKYDPEVIWAAGFFDGEGSVRTSVRTGAKGFPTARCTVTNTDPRPISKFQDLFGGVVLTRPGGIRSRRSFEWTIQGAELDSFVREILPFIVVKREQLELLQQFRKFMPGRGYRKMTSGERWKERKAMSKIATAITELKWVEADGI